MSQLNITRGQFIEAFQAAVKGDPSKIGAIYDAVNNGVSKWDYDSGWQTTPEDNIINHDLGLIPSQSLVYEADDIDGTNMVPATSTTANKNTITVNVSKSYVRVYANK